MMIFGILALCYAIFMIGTIITMFITKQFYKGYHASRNEAWFESDQIDFEMKFLRVALFPITIIGLLITAVFIKLGYLYGKARK